MQPRILDKISRIIDKKINLNYKIKKILEIEKKENLFKNESDYFAWDYLRSYFIRLLNRSDKSGKSYFWSHLINNILIKKKYFYLNYVPIFLNRSKKDIIFFGHNRGNLKKKVLHDEYLDSIINKFKKKKIQIFSYSHFFYGPKNNYKNKRFFIDYLDFLLKVKTIILFVFIIHKLKFIKTNKLKFELIVRYEQEKWWYNYFKSVKPVYLFIVDVHSHLPIVRAANRLKITIIEVQHGSPNSKKMEYLYSVPPNSRLSSPDYFLGFGKFWNRNISAKYYKKQFYSIGKKLDEKIPKLKKNNSNILVIDQLQFRKKLVNIAIKISKKNSSKISYRFHPNVSEKKSFSKKLKDHNISVSMPKSNYMAKDLSKVKTIIGVASTALLELSYKKYSVLIVPTEEFDFKNLLLQKKKYGLRELNNKLVRKSGLFHKPNFSIIKNIVK